MTSHIYRYAFLKEDLWLYIVGHLTTTNHNHLEQMHIYWGIGLLQMLEVGMYRNASERG